MIPLIAVSYAQDPSDKLPRDCRSLMQSAWYQSLFATRWSSECNPSESLSRPKAARGWRLRPRGTGRGAGHTAHSGAPRGCVSAVICYKPEGGKIMRLNCEDRRDGRRLRASALASASARRLSARALSSLTRAPPIFTPICTAGLARV
jgi:hypothetical protein